MSTRRSSRHKEHAEYESRYGKGTPAVAVEADVTEEEREQAGEGPSEVKPALEAPVELVKVEAGGVAAPGDDDELDVDVKEEDAKEEIGGSAGSVSARVLRFSRRLEADSLLDTASRSTRSALVDVWRATRSKSNKMLSPSSATSRGTSSLDPRCPRVLPTRR